MSRPARFTIRSVCALTGVNPNTLRAWERRYGLIQPERTASGYRLYTMQDVERLRAIQDLLNTGVPAGQVAKHLAQAAASEGSRPSERAVPAPTAARAMPGSVEEFATAVADAALSGDDARSERLFSRAVGLYGVARAFADVLLAAGETLGKRSDQGDLRAAEARQHLTAFGRRRIEKLLAGLKPLHQRPLVVCMNAGPCPTLEGELMRIGLELGMARVSTSYVVAREGPEPLTQALATGSVRSVIMTCGACKEGTPEWQKAAERMRGVKVHVVVNGVIPECEWLRSVNAEFLHGEVDESAQSLLRMLGRA